MKSYTTIPHQFFDEPMGREIRKMGMSAVAVATYLMINQSVNMLGIYRIPYCSIAYSLCASKAKVIKIIAELSKISFCKYDEDSDYIWVCDLADLQIGQQLHSNDKRVKHINELYHTLPKISFLRNFYDKYAEAFFITSPRENYIAKNLSTTAFNQKQQAVNLSVTVGTTSTSKSALNNYPCAEIHDKKVNSKTADMNAEAPSMGHLDNVLVDNTSGDTVNNDSDSKNGTTHTGASNKSNSILNNIATLQQNTGNTHNTISPIDGASKPVTVTEAVTETESSNSNKKTKAKKDFCPIAKDLRPNASPPTTFSDSVLEIFSHWQKRMNHPKAKLDAKRKRFIKQALKLGYGKDDLLKAIDGCAKSPFNMGKNDRGEIYDDLCLILRDASKIDRFMKMFISPPKESRKNETVYEHNLRQTKESMEKLKAQMLPDGTFDLCSFLEKEVARA